MPVRATAAGGAPGRTRTCGPRLRRPVLYPTELRARAGVKSQFTSGLPVSSDPSLPWIDVPSLATGLQRASSRPRIHSCSPIALDQIDDLARYGVRHHARFFSATHDDGEDYGRRHGRYTGSI